MEQNVGELDNDIVTLQFQQFINVYQIKLIHVSETSIRRLY